jgi:hypothetical protein
MVWCSARLGAGGQGVPVALAGVVALYQAEPWSGASSISKGAALASPETFRGVPASKASVAQQQRQRGSRTSGGGSPALKVELTAPQFLTHYQRQRAGAVGGGGVVELEQQRQQVSAGFQHGAGWGDSWMVWGHAVILSSIRRRAQRRCVRAGFPMCRFGSCRFQPTKPTKPTDSGLFRVWVLFSGKFWGGDWWVWWVWWVCLPMKIFGVQMLIADHVATP